MVCKVDHVAGCADYLQNLLHHLVRCLSLAVGFGRVAAVVAPAAAAAVSFGVASFHNETASAKNNNNCLY